MPTALELQTRLRHAIFSIRKQIQDTAVQSVLDKYADLVSPAMADGMGESRMPLLPGTNGYLYPNRVKYLYQLLSNAIAEYYFRVKNPGFEGPSPNAETALAIAVEGWSNFKLALNPGGGYYLVNHRNWVASTLASRKAVEEKPPAPPKKAVPITTVEAMEWLEENPPPSKNTLMNVLSAEELADCEGSRDGLASLKLFIQRLRETDKSEPKL